MKRALITGIGGQDGPYLAELLLRKNYEVIGTVRHVTPQTLRSIDEIRDRVELIELDLLLPDRLEQVIARFLPEEIYHLAAQSMVWESWRDPTSTSLINGFSMTHLLNAVLRHAPNARVFQAGSSEMFGATDRSPQDERAAFRPTNPYGASKLFAHQMLQLFRQRHGLFVCGGILYNHESPRRGESFVTRKIVQAAARVALGMQADLKLGDLEARRDWSHSRDVVEAMWLMLQAPRADDFVIGSGQTHSVADFANLAFNYVGLSWRQHVTIDPNLVRPREPVELRAAPDKAREELGWSSTTSLGTIVREMMDVEIARLRRELRQGNRRAA